MKKLALIVLALELAVCGCGNNTRTTNVTTSTSGNWEAQLNGTLGPSGQQLGPSQLNFVTSFNLTSTTGGASEPLDIIGFGFFNASECFATGLNDETETGSATLNTAGSGAGDGRAQLHREFNLDCGKCPHPEQSRRADRHFERNLDGNRNSLERHRRRYVDNDQCKRSELQWKRQFSNVPGKRHLRRSVRSSTYPFSTIKFGVRPRALMCASRTPRLFDALPSD